MSRRQNSPGHITTGNIFDDLEFLPDEAALLKSKAEILSALLGRIHQKRYTEIQLTEILGDDRSNTRNLLSGKISRMCMEKLLHYSTKLNMDRP